METHAADPRPHALHYRTGLDSEPFWYCHCGGFRYRAQMMPRRKTGNNKIEALRAFAKHKADQ